MLILFTKSFKVKQHKRTMASGKVVFVREHDKSGEHHHPDKSEVVPVPRGFLEWMGVESKPITANWASLLGKHPDQFKTSSELKKETINCLANPSFAFPASETSFDIVLRLGKENKNLAVTLNLEGKRGRKAYIVRSVHYINDDQVSSKMAIAATGDFRRFRFGNEMAKSFVLDLLKVA